MDVFVMNSAGPASEDRELLELAASAAGIALWSSGDAWRNSAQGVGFLLADGITVWNPLLDDGDAFRLLITLQMSILYSFSELEETYGRRVWSPVHGGVVEYAARAGAGHGTATRRAIVLSAAKGKREALARARGAA